MTEIAIKIGVHEAIF